MTYDEWLASLRAAQATRHYRPWGECAKPDVLAYHRIGRFCLLPRTDGRTVIVDTDRPWNDAAVSHHETVGDAVTEAQRLALLRPGAWAQ